MIAKKGRGGPQRPVKGFRPGKEPAHLKRQRAKAQLGSDAGWAQKQAVEAVAGRSAAEVRVMIRRWSLALAIAGLLLTVGGAFLYGWTWVAGVVAHVFAVVLFFLAYRIRKQGPGLEEMAKSL